MVERVEEPNIPAEGGRGAETGGGARGKEGGGRMGGAAPLLREDSLAAEFEARLDTGLEGWGAKLFQQDKE